MEEPAQQNLLAYSQETFPLQVSVEALGAFVPPEEREKAMRGVDRSETELGIDGEADVEAEVNEKVGSRIFLYR